MRSTLSMSLHFCRISLILSTSSGTTDVAATYAPPIFSDEEFTTDTALGPLQSLKMINYIKSTRMIAFIIVLNMMATYYLNLYMLVKLFGDFSSDTASISKNEKKHKKG